jgi:hypothetical protein
MLYLKQSTAVTKKIGRFIDRSDAVTSETGLTIAQANVLLSKNGGAFAQKNSAVACTHDADGFYDCPLSTTDTDTLGTLILEVNDAEALPYQTEYTVITAAAWELMFGTGLVSLNDASITAAKFAAGAIDANAIANNAIDSTAIAAGAITAASFAAGAIDATAIANGAIDAATFAAGAIDANAIATDAFGALELSAGAATEIVTALLAATYEGTVTVQDYLRLTAAILLNKCAGGGTPTITFQDEADTKARVTATMDTNGNRTAVVVDAT